MKRGEEILKAARDYVSSVTLSSPSNVIHFEAGAKWADKHPVNVWHDTSEKPILHKPILIQCGYPLHTYEATALSEDVIWGDFVVLNAIFGWAYIKALLPKGGEK